MENQYKKDVKTIEIQYYLSSRKQRTKINLASKMARRDALQIADEISHGDDVFMVRCWTDNNKFIFS